ncbi:hypothetical protein [Lentzea aerocolonigenes]|nr:hypothetical protein [Lentzea aerocolonigenes]
MEITEHELIEALQRDWPREFEISMLRVMNSRQSQRIKELEAGEEER